MMLAFKGKPTLPLHRPTPLRLWQMPLPRKPTPLRLLLMLPLHKRLLMPPFPMPLSQLLGSFWWELETQLMSLWMWVRAAKFYL
jgi:hypothetical protein